MAMVASEMPIAPRPPRARDRALRSARARTGSRCRQLFINKRAIEGGRVCRENAHLCRRRVRPAARIRAARPTASPRVPSTSPPDHHDVLSAVSSLTWWRCTGGSDDDGGRGGESGGRVVERGVATAAEKGAPTYKRRAPTYQRRGLKAAAAAARHHHQQRRQQRDTL